MFTLRFTYVDPAEAAAAVQPLQPEESLVCRLTAKVRLKMSFQ